MWPKESRLLALQEDISNALSGLNRDGRLWSFDAVKESRSRRRALGRVELCGFIESRHRLGEALLPNQVLAMSVEQIDMIRRFSQQRR